MKNQIKFNFNSKMTSFTPTSLTPTSFTPTSLTLVVKKINYFPRVDAINIKLSVSTMKELITSGFLQKINNIDELKEEFSELVFSPGDQFNFLSTTDKMLISIEIDYMIPSSYTKQYFFYFFELLETLFQKDKEEIESNPRKFANTYIGLGPTEKAIMKANGIPLTMLDRYKFKIQQYTTELEKIKTSFESESISESENENIINKYNELLDDLEGVYEFNILLGSFDRIPTVTWPRFGKESKKRLLEEITKMR